MDSLQFSTLSQSNLLFSTSLSYSTACILICVVDTHIQGILRAVLFAGTIMYSCIIVRVPCTARVPGILSFPYLSRFFLVSVYMLCAPGHKSEDNILVSKSRQRHRAKRSRPAARRIRLVEGRQKASAAAAGGGGGGGRLCMYVCVWSPPIARYSNHTSRLRIC